MFWILLSWHFQIRICIRKVFHRDVGIKFFYSCFGCGQMDIFDLKDVKSVYYLINQSTFTFWYSSESRHNITKHELWRLFFSKEVLTTLNLITLNKHKGSQPSFIPLSSLLACNFCGEHSVLLSVIVIKHSECYYQISVEPAWPTKYYGQLCFYLQPPRCWGDGSHSPGISWQLRSSGSKQFPAMWVSDW